MWRTVTPQADSHYTTKIAMLPEIRISSIEGLPEIEPGDDLAGLIADAATAQGTNIDDGDVLVVAQKVVSKAEGRLVDLNDVTPSALAIEIASMHERDPRHTEVVLRECKRIVRMDRGVIIAETRHGFRCANAGVDASNAPSGDIVVLLPVDPDASARRLASRLKQRLNVSVAIIISDTFGRPWREGAVNVAIGVAGINPMLDFRGLEDPQGRPLRTTTIAVVDELAAAAGLVMGKLDRTPAVLLKGCRFDSGDDGIGELIRPAERDLFR